MSGRSARAVRKPPAASAVAELEARVAALTAELHEAREQQTATAELLQVINASQGELAPVFDAILQKAHDLCGAALGAFGLVEGEIWRAVAMHGYPEPLAQRLRDANRISDHPLVRPLRDGARIAHFPDLAQIDHPIARAAVEGGIRTVLLVPLRKGETFIGTISAARRGVRPFSDDEIALLENFAAQSVIAMENARLITETREALEQQTATADVLRVINSSPGDLAGVFDAMLASAMRLCGAAFGALGTWQDDRFSFLAYRATGPLADYCANNEVWPGPREGFARIAKGAGYVQFADISQSKFYRSGDSFTRAIVDLGGARATLGVPLVKDEDVVGLLAFYRQEAKPFSEKEIGLVKNFAAQAVIAMENARLINETQEALEQQTATAEILQVINASPGDLAPVFDAMLERAMRLCGADFGLLNTYDGESFQATAERGVPAAYAEFRRRQGPHMPYGPGTGPARLAAGEDVVYNLDLMAEEAYERGDPNRRALVDLGGARSHLAVALRKDRDLVGVLTIYRQEVRPFTDKEIGLLQNFAAQAVIAMENARLLGELRARTRDLEESLEYQTATSDVLKVISRSTFDLQPILDTVCSTARRLCGAGLAAIAVRRGEAYRYVATNSVNAEWTAMLHELDWSPGRESIAGRVSLERRTVHVDDLAADPEYIDRGAIAIGGARTALGVPLLREGEPIGTIFLARQQVQPFTERQIDLVRTFADQAVIAIENTRLLGELQDRTRDLQESLEYQTATSDVLKVISRSTFDLQRVLETLAESAAVLAQSDTVFVFRREGEHVRLVAQHAPTPAFGAVVGTLTLGADRGSTTGRAFMTGKVVHIPDVQADPDYRLQDFTDADRIRSTMAAPLLREGVPIGVITLARLRVEPYTERQIELVRTFADQAVIAIENTRLITETREALEQQTATTEVLQVINSSPDNLAPVFDAMLDKALHLCEAAFGTLWTYDGEYMHASAVRGAPPQYLEFLKQGPHRPSRIAHQRLLSGDSVDHIADITSTEGYLSDDPLPRAVADLGGVRTLLAVPLRKDQDVTGIFSIYRQAVRPFSEKQIALLQNFAAQAVIAMDNARLLSEIRQRQAELRVTFDNMGDGVAMFDAGLRLAAWNRNFQQLLELPDEFVTGRPSFADYLRFLAERGEYGTGDVEAELSRRLERAGEELRLERTRPDGRIIELRRNAVPGGGFVLMYSDVTERKRAEAEIRAARDAAEKALGELQTAQASLVHAEKMASLGQLTAGIAHEIKNPLNFVNNFAGLSVELLSELKETAAPAFDTLDADKRAEIDETIAMLTGNLGKIGEHGRRADGIVKSMLAHSRGTSGERQAVDLNALVDEALNLAYHGARAQDQNFNITLERAFDRALAPIELAPQEMTRVFLNLIGNGFYAATKRQREGAAAGFRPTLRVATRDLGEAVEVNVRDNGTGILPEHRDKLFQPFFTTKPTGEGTGLGLSISWDIVTQQHGGTMTVESEPGTFTEFTVRLPRKKSLTGESAGDARRTR